MNASKFYQTNKKKLSLLPSWHKKLIKICVLIQILHRKENNLTLRLYLRMVHWETFCFSSSIHEIFPKLFQRCEKLGPSVFSVHLEGECRLASVINNLMTTQGGAKAERCSLTLSCASWCSCFEPRRRQQKRLEPIYYSPKPIGSQWSWARRQVLRVDAAARFFLIGKKTHVRCGPLLKNTYNHKTHVVFLLILRRAKVNESARTLPTQSTQKGLSRSFLYSCLCWKWFPHCVGAAALLINYHLKNSRSAGREINFPSRRCITHSFLMPCFVPSDA